MTWGRCVFRWLITLALAGVSLAGIALMVLGFFIFVTAGTLPRVPNPLSRIIETPKTEIYAAGGEKLITLGRQEPVPLERISPHFINAILAVEDHRFFSHPGIRKLRTLKALYITLFQPGKIQGASTITQQLAKNLFFSFEQTYLRKFKELLVALQIESAYSKREILHAYVNQIAFGAGAQGVERASRVYFNKPAADITLPEAALLAGLPKSPTRYNPYRHYERALRRQKVVLGRMVTTGNLTRQAAEAARAHPPKPAFDHADARTGSYFLDSVIEHLVKEYGSAVVFHGGIQVFTTLDTRMQQAAEDSVNKGLADLDRILVQASDNKKVQAALVAVDPETGAVRAMAGGRDYHRSEFNRALSARRQPGSGFKPFLYYAAFETLGYHGATRIEDAPIRIDIPGSGEWRPENADGTFRGMMPLKQALTDSVNTVAARLVRETGPEAVIRTARQCGISAPLDPVPSIALGTSPVTPFEMAAAYAVFAASGFRRDPFMVSRVEDAAGRVLFEHLVRDQKVLDAATTYQIVDMMVSVVDHGSGSRVRQLGFKRPAAGKTGTTDRFRDAWFTGFTPGLCTSVWVGHDNRTPLMTTRGNGITGSRGALPVWTHFMDRALKNEPIRRFSIPGTLTFHTISSRTGCPPEGSESSSHLTTIPLKPGQRLCTQKEMP